MSRYWLGIVSKDHVQRGVKDGFAQVCHGKKGQLSKMKSGDWLIYYSPKQSMESNDSCKSFTAIGKIKTGEVYQVEMFPGFKPFRLHVEYFTCRETPISSLINLLEFTQDSHWGFVLRRGLIELSETDFLKISKHMLKK